MINVMVVDDHTILRKGILEILSHAPDIGNVSEATTGFEAISLLRQHEVDVVVLDIEMPGRSGIEVLKDIRAAMPGVKVLMLSMHPVEQYAVRSIRAGASGYLTKERSPYELISAIREVARGGMYIDAQVAAELALVVGGGQKDTPHELLSDREMEVMLLLAHGRTAAEIAESLHLSVNTVSTYRARILTKMKLRNNAEIAYYAVKSGLTD